MARYPAEARLSHVRALAVGRQRDAAHVGGDRSEGDGRSHAVVGGVDDLHLDQVRAAAGVDGLEHVELAAVG
jgi:hypothetical protein